MIVLNCEPGEIKRVRKPTIEMTSEISLEQEVLLSILLRDKKHFEVIWIFFHFTEIL